jgi:hypothetical protein
MGPAAVHAPPAQQSEGLAAARGVEGLSCIGREGTSLQHVPTTESDMAGQCHIITLLWPPHTLWWWWWWGGGRPRPPEGLVHQHHVPSSQLVRIPCVLLALGAIWVPASGCVCSTQGATAAAARCPSRGDVFRGRGRHLQCGVHHPRGAASCQLPVAVLAAPRSGCRPLCPPAS